MNRRLSALLFPLVFVVGLGVLLYPTISDRWNRHVQSRAIVDYAAAVGSMGKKDFSREFAAVEDYNAALRSIRFPLMYADRVAGYEGLLTIADTDIMGYVTIEAIGVELPIYHGTSDAVLNVGVGHLQGTSLPIGGESTHAVLSAHRGLPSAKLFTNLDRLQVGDSFTLTVLDRTLTYTVDQILTVLPDAVDALYVQDGYDYCTLMTCTPYGINTHRLLVRGIRTLPQREVVSTQAMPVTSDAEILSAPLAGAMLALPAATLMIVCVLLQRLLRRKRSKEESIGVL